MGAGRSHSFHSLTLCLVVAGRHIESLGILQLLLSNSQALTLPQKFYQRSLSGDPHEIINDARVFLRRNSLTSYCDRVLIPAIHLAHLDAHRGATSEEQRVQIRRVVVDVVSALSSEGLRLPKRRYGSSVLDEDNVGNWLRQQRERVSGRWQGPLGVAPGSVVLCLGLGSPADDLVAELFARVLLVQKLDARHFALAELNDGLPEGADPNGVSLVYLMSAFPETEREHAHPLQTRIRTTFPHAHVITVFFPGISGPWNMKVSVDDSCLLANSLTEALEISHGLSADSGVRNPNGHCP